MGLAVCVGVRVCGVVLDMVKLSVLCCVCAVSSVPAAVHSAPLARVLPAAVTSTAIAPTSLVDVSMSVSLLYVLLSLSECHSGLLMSAV